MDVMRALCSSEQCGCDGRVLGFWRMWMLWERFAILKLSWERSAILLCIQTKWLNHLNQQWHIICNEFNNLEIYKQLLNTDRIIKQKELWDELCRPSFAKYGNVYCIMYNIHCIVYIIHYMYIITYIIHYLYIISLTFLVLNVHTRLTYLEYPCSWYALINSRNLANRRYLSPEVSGRSDKHTTIVSAKITARIYSPHTHCMITKLDFIFAAVIFVSSI